MLVTKSRYSFNSVAPDRVATLKPAEIAKIASRRGWPFVLLADERTLAGSLRFLATAKDAGIPASAGMQVSGLAWAGSLVTIILMPLDQSGLERLVRSADGLARAASVADLARALPCSPDGPMDIAAIVLPSRDSADTAAEDCATLRAALLRARLGPAVGVAEAGRTREPLPHAPWAAAQHVAAAGGFAMARLSMAYAAEDPDPAVRDGLEKLAEESGDEAPRKATSARPRMPSSYAIPERDASLAEDGLGQVSASLHGRVQPMSLARAPTLPARLGLRDGEDPAATVRALSRQGLEDKARLGLVRNRAEASARLETELALITGMGFSNYFLIVREAIAFARRSGIPVGPGRGSAAGSMAAWCLGITNIDPIKHRLLFERFINPERISLPDIDTDLCEQRRHEVIAYLAEKYGDDRVAHISTYSSRQPRGAVRTAASILNMRAIGNRVIGAIEERLGKVKGLPEAEVETRVTAAIESIATSDADAEVRRLAGLASTFLGIASTHGTHAGGIVLSDGPLSSLAPINPDRTPQGRLSIQFDMNDTERCGLVKFDFLGLSTLTVMQRCLDDLRSKGIEVDLETIGYDDADVFKLMRSGRNRTVFQLEGGGISQKARDVGIDDFEDVVALLALYRPGPMAHIETYASRKRGDSETTYLHPSLEAALSGTYGIAIYQEQILRMAQDFAGYSLAQADLLRKAIGKKNAKLLNDERASFIARAVDNGQTEEMAEEVFGFIRPFAEYGFNRSHAVAYATIAYQTAWLKTHHPAAWLASCAEGKTSPEERAKIIADAARGGTRLRLPDIRDSGAAFRSEALPEGGMGILAPLSIVHGARSQHVSAILRARESAGGFRSMTHLLSLLDPTCDATIEALVRAGACDCLSPHPPTIARPHFLALLSRPAERAEKPSGMASLLDLAPRQADVGKDPEPRLWPNHADGMRAWSPDEALAIQEDLLKGLIAHERGQIRTTDWLREIESLVDIAQAEKIAIRMPTRTLGILVELGDREQPGAQGQRVIQATVEDQAGRYCYDVAPGTAIDPALGKARGRVVRLTLSPSPQGAFIRDKPTVTEISACEDPLDAAVPPYPLIHLDREIDDEVRAELRQAHLEATRRASAQRRAAKGSPAQAPIKATHALLVPPSRALEAFQLTEGARTIGVSSTFGHLDLVAHVSD